MRRSWPKRARAIAACVCVMRDREIYRVHGQSNHSIQIDRNTLQVSGRYLHMRDNEKQIKINVITQRHSCLFSICCQHCAHESLCMCARLYYTCDVFFIAASPVRRAAREACALCCACSSCRVRYTCRTWWMER
jgi:hypothetical protein